jgi:hypothetical protein
MKKAMLAFALLFAAGTLAQQPGTPTFTTFEAPGASTSAYQGTIAFGINTAGAIAGYYGDESFVYHGFVRAADGTITTFGVPGAGTGNSQGTTANSINVAGTIAGYYSDASFVYAASCAAPVVR